MNPYTLPDGNVQISFSGGRTSAYMLHQIAEANGGIPDRCKVVFANTGREMPQTLDFAQMPARFGYVLQPGP
jgi:3'-phosphoadenosine 5'-phosphosulfate sulfotransferase (PAPS reductase)/FAD synthetase